MTDLEEEFCQVFVSTGNKTEALVVAYGRDRSKNPYLRMEAQKIYNRPHVKARVAELQAEVAEQHGITRDLIIQKHMDLVNWFEELIGLISKEFEGRQLTKYDYIRKAQLTEMVRGADYRGSLDSLAKMLGYNQPEKVEIKDTTYTVKWS